MTFYKVYNFFVGETIASGTFSTIRSAYRQDNLSPVAIKLISKRKIIKNTNYKQMLFAEEDLAPLLNHPHLVPIFETFESQRQIFQVMKLAKTNLIYYLRRAKLPPRAYIKIIDDILSAVEYLHTHYICHRDIKLDNILVDDDKNIYLCDFGFACFAVNPCHEKVGSIGYSAPEVLLNDEYDGLKADMWSLGVLIYRLYSNHCPFPDSQDFSKFNENSINYSRIPEDVRPIIRSLLQIDPNKRPTASELRRNPLFSTLHNRIQNSTEDFDEPISNSDCNILRRMSELLQEDISSIAFKLGSYGISEEKIFYIMNYTRLYGKEDIPENDAIIEVSSCPMMETPLIPVSPQCMHRKSFTLTKVEGRQVMDDVRQVLMNEKFCVSDSPNGIHKAVLNTPDDDIHIQYDVEDRTDNCLVSIATDGSTCEELDKICLTMQRELSSI
ncbi:CAMK family protein kinase [Histomonas meleagridis]|uniref:CAMK family protein kinase n=1 Tax=Histomonas meleagridis TaxID=135588 RepID=UPI00355A738F|nr:CAMK family protein kinase [Histomonas meleagridis]KAH0801406.1 CAMK family protein kinase [Histomonas meleagridis]